MFLHLSVILVIPLTETPIDRPLPRMVPSGQYTSYWNAFLLKVECEFQIVSLVAINLIIVYM